MSPSRAAPRGPAALLAAALLSAPACSSQRPAEPPPQPATADLQRAPAAEPPAAPDPEETAEERAERTHQCNRLIRVINAENKKLELGGEDVEDMAQLSKDAEAAAVAVGAVDVSLPELVQYRGRAKKLLLDFSAAARETGEAMQSEDAERMSAMLSTILQMTRENGALNAEINLFCHGQLRT